MTMNGAGRMRAPDWEHEETLLLAKLRRDAVFSRTIEGVWTRIGNTILNHFGHTRSDDQCKRRWETLQKVHKTVQAYCEERHLEHWQLTRSDWESMKLATAYNEEWYVVVKEVCEEEKVRKQRKRRRSYPEPIQPRPSEYNSGQAVIVPAPNVHEDPQSSGTTVDAQSSTSLMPSLQVENLPPSQAKIERLKNKIQTLRLQLQLAEQELQQITQGDQEVLGNSSSPGTSQSSQVMEHDEPLIPGTSAAPQQFNVKHNIKTPNPAGGDGTGCSIFLDPFPVFEKAVETPLPMLTADDTWASWICSTRTQFVPTGYPDLMNSGARTNLSLSPHRDQQGCGITLTIDTRIIIKATQNPLPNTHPVTRTGHSYQERSTPSIDLRLSTETTIREDEEHQKLNTELRTLQQQLQNVIQKISQVKPIGSPGSEVSAPCDAINWAITPVSQSGWREKDTAAVATEEEPMKPNNTGIDLNHLPSPTSNEVSGGSEPDYYIVAADDIAPAPERGLTESLALMSLSPSTTKLKSDQITTKKKKELPETTTTTTTTTTTPPASIEGSLKIEDDYPQGSLCLTMDQSWLASARPSSVCDELLGRSVPNMGIYKSSMNSQSYKSHVKDETQTRWWRLIEHLMRTFSQFKRFTLPLSEENHLIADGNLGHDFRETQPTTHNGDLSECTDCNY